MTKGGALTGDDVLLALRPYEGYAIYDDYAPGRYAIALVQTPPMPGDAHEECWQLGTVAAYHYYTLKGGRAAWGWVHLSAATKRILSADLVEMGAEIGRWYFVEMGAEL